MTTPGQDGRRDGARPATLRDVADRAGVSTSTASLVFSGKGPVRAETRERVLAAATALGYDGPNPLAASLRTGRSGVVAVLLQTRVIDALRDPYAVSVLDGLADVLDSAGCGMLLVTRTDDEPRAVAQLRAAALDAAVFLSAWSGPRGVVDHLAARGVPIVGLGAPLDPRVVQCDIDDHAAATLAAEHLRALGHHRVAHVALPLGLPSDEVLAAGRVGAVDSPHAAERVAAVAEAFGSGTPVVSPAAADVEAGAAAGRLLLDVPAPGRPTAVLAGSDMLAIGVVRAAESLGLRVPDDVSVTGIDGIDTPWWPRRLTTVEQPGRGKGRAAAELVLRLAGGSGDAGGTDGTDRAGVLLPAALRVGDTTAPPPTDG